MYQILWHATQVVVGSYLLKQGKTQLLLFKKLFIQRLLFKRCISSTLDKFLQLYPNDNNLNLVFECIYKDFDILKN